MSPGLSCRATILAQRARLLNGKELAALILIGAWNGCFGRVRLAETLAGDLSEKIGAARLRKAPQFGIAQAGGLQLAFEILNNLDAAGLIATKWKARTYPLLVLTPAGVEALRKASSAASFKVGSDRSRESGAGLLELYAKLVAWRDRLAEVHNRPREQIADMAQIRRLIQDRPDDLQKVLERGYLSGQSAELFGHVVVAIFNGRVGFPR